MLSPLSEDTLVATGMRLVHIASNTHFTVLCNCSASKPRHYTQRFITQNRGLYALPPAHVVAAPHSAPAKVPPPALPPTDPTTPEHVNA